MRRSGFGWLVIGALVAASAACGGDIRAPRRDRGASDALGGTGGGGALGGSSGDGGLGGGARGGTGGIGGYGGTGAGGTGGSGGDLTCQPGVPATSQIPRLTAKEYDRTIRDLLGVTTLTAAGNVTPSTLLATDQIGSITDIAWSAYQSVAEQIAAQVMADPTLKQNFIHCTPEPDDTTCFHDTIVEFGRRAFRRPLAADEVAAFEAIVAQGAAITAHGLDDEIAETLLFMFLLSPSFLQRSETAEVEESSGFLLLSSLEIAQRLSYMLWGSTPDPALDDAADSDALRTQDQIYAQAERMLADPRAREMVADFHRYYLQMGEGSRWSVQDHDATAFPGFTKDLLPVMQSETERLLDDVVFAQKGDFRELFLTDKAFVSAATAPFYGLDAGDFAAELTETTLDAAARPGFLTRLAFLSGYSSYQRTSPILRGAFIAQRVLGIQLGAHPPDVGQTPLPELPELDTNRKRTEAWTSDTSCAACHHEYVNPFGYVLEAFDAVGRSQTTEATTGAPIDTVADVNIDENTVTVANPAELMQAIVDSERARRRYAAMWTAFAYRREPAPADTCTVDTLSAKMASGGYPILNLVADLTQSQSFRMRAVAQP